jgi:ketosteroid isomerase-like protein
LIYSANRKGKPERQTGKEYKRRRYMVVRFDDSSISNVSDAAVDVELAGSSKLKTTPGW